ncbi:radical SAM protein [Nocardiopsis potens]|uniref:radical SAM protein n=1 Tax=Nocardiopsis potens TaxID=1246458 RepID=UPI0003462CE9|nr:radical SAM protein [Nocardiopsis potens]
MPTGRGAERRGADPRSANRELNIREFESGATALESLPRVLFVELTENCNLSCPMCRASGPFDRSKNMDPRLFERVAGELFPTAEIVDLRGWGESTVLKDFPERVARTIEYGCRVRLVTNLTVPNEELWRTLVRNDALILVSFDAARSRTFAELRRGARLPVIMRNLEILVDEGRRSGVGTDGVQLNVVVQAAAIPEIPAIVHTAADVGLTRIRLNPVTVPEDSPEHLSRHTAALADALEEAAGAARERGVAVQLGAALDESWALPEHTGKTCVHPWMYCYVNHRGQIGFCDHLIGEPDSRYLLGDLAESSFADIWNGPEYRRLRAEHTRWQEGISPRFEECDWCYRNRYVDMEEQSYPPYAEHMVNLTGRPRCPVGAAPPPPPPPGGGGPAPEGRPLLPLLGAPGPAGGTCG